MDQRVVEDPVLRQRMSFRRDVDDDGEVLYVEAWVEPGGGVPPHVHPALEERFEVKGGTMSFLAGRTWRTAGPGETVIAPAGVRHAYRNRGTETGHFVCAARPPSTLQAMLEDAAALSRARKLTRGGFPKGVNGLLQAAVMAEAYRDMVAFGFPPLPPGPIQRLLLPPLARLGERRGYRAGQLGDR